MNDLVKVQYVGPLNKRRVIPFGRREFETDEEGVAEVPDALAKQICKQADWKTVAIKKEKTRGE